MRFPVARLQAFLLAFAFLPTSYAAEPFEIASSIHDGTSVEFIAHSGPGSFDSYLIMNLPFEPMRGLFAQVAEREKKKLQHRGEAHITVITPVEYWEVLRERVSIEEIDRIAEEHGIQQSRFEIECMGRGTAVLGGKPEHAYYVVVRSEDLLAIRRSVAELFASRGGDPGRFDPAHYFPHITLGFTRRDLHESDGVVKDSATCIAPITEAR